PAGHRRGFRHRRRGHRRCGSVVIVLPVGWAVDADRLGKAMGSKTIKVPRTPSAGQPLLVLYGNVGFGSLKVRPASGREQRRIDQQRS
ncbi:MAG: hypothetical protein L0H26_11910, partial [Microlunatus sp.]|nr:hypothetical protein [Microlunatus sp.]